MATITYQVTLASDGKPTVSVTADDPDAAREAIPWVAQTYATLLKDARAIPRPATTVANLFSPLRWMEAAFPRRQLPRVRRPHPTGP